LATTLIQQNLLAYCVLMYHNNPIYLLRFAGLTVSLQDLHPEEVCTQLSRRFDVRKRWADADVLVIDEVGTFESLVCRGHSCVIDV
jgi:hypothetical protein